MSEVKAHFVTFFSPGSFFAEETTKPISSWNVDTAIEMAFEIRERYNARPYGFQFSTRERGHEDLDSKVTQFSGVYYLGGKIETLAEIERRNLPEEKILLSNMKSNGWDKIVTNRNSWRWTMPLREKDILLDVQF